MLAVALLIGGFAIVATPTRASGADRVRVLVPSTRYTASPSLAVNAGGASLVSWFGGPAPIVSMEPLRGHHHYYVGEKLFAAVGTLGHGFGSPVLLAAHASEVGNAIQGPLAALTGSGVGFVAWRSGPSGPIIVAVEHAGRFGRARVLLPAYDQLVALAAAPGGPVIAVWAVSPRLGVHEPDSYDYARLSAAGALGRTVRLSNIQGNDSQAVAVSVNDAGAIAVAWVRGVGNTAGSHVRVVACDRSMRCSVTASVPLFPSWPHYFNVAVSLNNSGEVTVLADDGPSSTTRAAIAPIGGAYRVLAGSIAGADPLAAASTNATMVIVSGTPDRVETIPPTARSLSAGVPLNGLGEVGSVSADAAGDFVASAAHTATAAVGGPLATSDHVVRLTRNPGWFTTQGIDARGDALVIWDEFLNNQGRGLFAATYQS